jgi:hypothetical protein
VERLPDRQSHRGDFLALSQNDFPGHPPQLFIAAMA